MFINMDEKLAVHQKGPLSARQIAKKVILFHIVANEWKKERWAPKHNYI